MKKLSIKGLRKWKGVVSFCMALLILFCSTFVYWDNEFTVLYADGAQDRVKTFISLAAGKQSSVEEIENLTTDELRFLGIYLSNFYIPFFSELGIGNTNSLETQKTQMAKAISNNLHYNESVAEILVDSIIDMSRTNYKELVVRVQDSTGAWVNPYSRSVSTDCIARPDGTFPNQEVRQLDLSYDVFLSLMFGENPTLVEANTIPNNKVFIGYEKGGEFCPVFDAIVGSGSVNECTASQVAFRQCLGSLSLSDGYGTSVFDFDSTEADGNKDIFQFFKDSAEDLGESDSGSGDNFDFSEVMNNSIFKSKMAVDCFGNIIFMGINHQYIVVPGCMNPYTWTRVSASGDDLTTGDSYQVVNYAAMAKADVGDLWETTFDRSASTMQINQSSFATQMSKQVGNKVKNAGKGMWVWTDKDHHNEPHLVYRYYRGSNVTSSSSSFLETLLSSEDFTEFQYYQALFRVAEANGNWAKPATKLVTINSKVPNSANYYNTSPTVTGWTSEASSGVNPIWKKTKNSISFIDTMIFIDNLQAFGFTSEDDAEIDTNTFNFISYLNQDGASSNKLAEEYGRSSTTAFTSGGYSFGSSNNKKSNGEMMDIKVDEATTVMLYTTYAVASLYKDDPESKQNTIGKLGWRANIEGLPEINSKSLNIPNNVKEDLMLKDIRNWIYYILHPRQGQNYTRTLIRTKVNAVLVGWHNDMLGTNNVGNNTGVSLYRSNTGYVTTPDLSEIQWTSSLISLYNTAIPFLIVIMLVILLFAFVAGIMSFQKALFGLIIFSCFLFTPVTLINNVVGMSNNISQRIYGNKFTYWALVQQESYSKSIDEYANKDSYENYLRELYAKNSAEYSNQGNNSIVLKWQAPKKMASLMLTSDSDSDVMSGLKSTKVVQGILGKSMSGENYLEHDSDYLYRSYIDLSNFSRYTWRGINKGVAESTTKVQANDSMTARLEKIKETYKSDIDSGYTNSGSNENTNYTYAMRLTRPFTSKLYKDAVAMKGKIKELKSTDYVGLHQGLFNFSIPMFNQKGVTYETLVEQNTTEQTKQEISVLLNGVGYDSDKNKELTGLASYALMSESPYYYYSWGLYDQGLIPESTSSTYKDLILGVDNGGYFYNMKGNGELKDFMDMRSLFTYIIPYLKQGNDVVREWDEVYGISIYDGVPVEEGHGSDSDIVGNKELQKKYWHNLNVARLYEIYSPWVDLMYDSKYANPTDITVMGQSYRIEDPLDPMSYPNERPMIFSESEMYDLGLSEADLTEVERRILKCNREMEERMYELLNYYSFSDVTLNTAASMNCTFVFNTVFSDNGWIFKDNVNLYPQSFEINDFSFDAFLRFILANTIGEDLASQEDFYATVVDRSSTTTALMLLVDDVLSQYALPAFKIFFIMSVFISAVLLIIATSFRVDPEQKFINKLLKGICIPMLGLLAINIGFSWVLSLFMGVGNNQVTQSNVLAIQTGDPVIALLIIGALDIACIVLYCKLLYGILQDIKHNFKLSTSFVQGAIGGTFQVAGFAITKGRQTVSNKVSGAGGIGGYNEEGTGRQSARATRRASQNLSEARNEDTPRKPYRVNEANHQTIKQSKQGVDKRSKSKENKINETIKSGSKKIDTESKTGQDRVNAKAKGSTSVKDLGDRR